MKREFSIKSFLIMGAVTPKIKITLSFDEEKRKEQRQN